MWSQTLQDASWRGVAFEVENVTRSNTRAVAANEYPYTSGADLEDMGLRPRRVRLRAVLRGDQYEQQLAMLASMLDMPGAGELVHPIHGAMQCVVESWDDEHQADLVDGCTVNMVFVEDKPRELAFSLASPQGKASAVVDRAGSARTAADAELERRVARVPASSTRRLSALRSAFAQVKARLAAALAVFADVRQVLTDLDPILYPRAYAGELLGMVDRALQGLPFGGRNILFGGVNDPTISLSSRGAGLEDYQAVRGAVDPLAMTVAVDAAGSADAAADVAVAVAHAQVHCACAIAEAAAIVLAGEAEDALLDRADVELLANQARSAVQVAIDAARAAFDGEGRALVSAQLRGLAAQIQAAARAVIEARPPVVQRGCPVDGPVRLVAHALYGDADRAGELVRLNRLGREVFLARGEVLNAYAV